MSDLIERQAAIDELEERLRANGYGNVALVSELNRSIGYIMRLSSAQPEIVWCKNCRFYRPMEDEDDLCDYRLMQVFDDDFCSRAERRTDDN